MNKIVVACLASLLVIVSASPAGADARYASSDAALIHEAAAQLEMSADDFHVTAAGVHHFLLGVSGAIEQSSAGCALNLSEVLDASTGGYRFSTAFADSTSLDIVAAHYCVDADQAHRLNAALLIFLASLATGEAVSFTLPPPSTGEPALLLTGVNTDLPAGRYVSFATTSCEIRRLSSIDPMTTIATVTAQPGEQIVLDIEAADAGLELQPGCGTWNMRTRSTSPSQPNISIPPGLAIVGVDVTPGRYRSTPMGVCGVARLSGFGGTFGELISSDVYSADTAVVLDVAETDVGLVTDANCGGWVLQDEE